MSTPCRIIRKNNDNTITVISLHFDGYLAGAGWTLSNYYTNQAAVDRLMNLGDLSMLGETPIELPGYWNRDTIPEYKNYQTTEEYEAAMNVWRTRRERFCGTYKSRGETDCEAVTVPAKDYKKVRKEDGPFEYQWDGSKWSYRGWNYDTKRWQRWQPITDKAVEASLR